MKSRISLAAVFVCLFAGLVVGDPNTQISFVTSDLGSGQWQYTYTVENLPGSQIPEIEEFTIWFDYELYDNLVVTTPDPLASDWDEIYWDPELILEDDGAYDAKAEAWILGIGVDETVGGFSVSFDWLGTGQPASQFYEIVDPIDFHTIESGWTVPEPGTLLLLGMGACVLLGNRKRRG